MTDQITYNVTEAHITQTPGICGGKPCIAGRRIRIQDVYVWHEFLGMSAEEIASEYSLTVAQVYAALTYCFDHLASIQADMQADETTIKSIKKQYQSKIMRFSGLL